jgi:kynurenine formamidase
VTEPWREVADRVRNWGRWGPADELGTLNYITPEKIVEAASLVRRGTVISLSAPFDSLGPWGPGAFRRNPVHLMTVDGGDADLAEHMGDWGGPTEQQLKAYFADTPRRFTDDVIFMSLQSGTQWDAFSHVYYDGKLYNGYPATSVTSRGAAKDSIDKVAKRGIVTRGVLADVARHRGVPWMEAGTPITPTELDEVLAAERVSMSPGDILIVRTGWWTRFATEKDEKSLAGGSPGLHWRCVEWMHDHQVAAVASDNIAVEAGPAEADARSAFHMIALRDMGLMMGELWDLQELSDDCQADGCYEFLLSAPPIHFVGAVGSPLNPLAVK